MATVGKLMTTRLVTTGPDEKVANVAAQMAELDIGAVLIVDAGKLTGIFSERDLLKRVVGAGKSPADTTIGEVATSDIITVDPDTSARRCAELLREHGIRHLPVAKNGEPVGIISARDFFAYVASGLERLINKVQYEQALEEGLDPYDHLGGGYGA